MIAIDDPALPGLSRLDAAALRRIAAAERVEVMRLRYRAGQRAIVQLSIGGPGQGVAGQGTLWLFAGDKASRLADRNRAAVFDRDTRALFEPFPQDHRMPEIRAFLKTYPEAGAALIGGAPAGVPVLLRYRPGLSCTFRCARADGAAAYVKLIRDEPVQALAQVNAALADALRRTPVGVAPVTGTDAALAAIGYGAAPGIPLEAALAAAGDPAPMGQAIDALARLWRARVTPVRTLGAAALLRRGRDCLDLARVTVPAALAPMKAILARLEARVPRLALRPIHGDMKLEHLFLDGRRSVLIDTESLALGPPDYDLAQLYGRLWQAEADGALPTATVAAAAAMVRAAAGPGFDWCLGAVALRLARFHAQRPGPAAAGRVAAILERLA